MKRKLLLNSAQAWAILKTCAIIVVVLCPCIAATESNTAPACRLAILTKQNTPEVFELLASLVMQNLAERGNSFVERQDLETIIDEQMQNTLFEKPLALGELLNADFLLLFEEAKTTDANGVRFRIIEVKTGIRWLDDIFELAEKNLENTANHLADLVHSLILRKSTNIRYYASVTPFENHTTDYELDNKMLGLTRLLEMIIVQSDDMILLEREDAQLLLQEHALSPLKLMPNTSVFVLGGTLKRTPPDKQGNTTVQLTLEISSPGKISEKSEISLDSLLAGDPVEILLDVLNKSRIVSVSQSKVPFDLERETTVLLKRADELFNLGQYHPASEAYAALIMLGLKNRYTYHSLVMSYAQRCRILGRENMYFSDSFYNSMLEQLELFNRAISTLDEAYSAGYYGDSLELRKALCAVWGLLEQEAYTIVSSRRRHCNHLAPEQLYHYRQLEEKALRRADGLAKRILGKEDLWYLSRTAAEQIREHIDRAREPDDTFRNKRRLEAAHRMLGTNPTDAETIRQGLQLLGVDLSRSEKRELESWNNVYVDLYVNYWNYCNLKDKEKILPLAIKCRDSWKKIAGSSSPRFLSKFANNLGEDTAVKMAFDADMILFELGDEKKAVDTILETLRSFPVTNAEEILEPVSLTERYYCNAGQPQKAVKVLEDYYRRLLTHDGTYPGGSPRMMRKIAERIQAIRNTHNLATSAFTKREVLFKKITQLENVRETRFPGDIYAFNGKIYPNGERVLIAAEQHIYLTRDGQVFTALTGLTPSTGRTTWLSDVCAEDEFIWAVYRDCRLQQWSWDGHLLGTFTLAKWLPPKVQKICITCHDGRILVAFACWAKQTPGGYVATVGAFLPDSNEFKVLYECRKRSDAKSGTPEAGFRPIEFLHLPGSDEIFLRTCSAVIKLHWPTRNFSYISVAPWRCGRATFLDNTPWFITKNYGINGRLQSATAINGDIYLVGDALVVLHKSREEDKLVTYALPEALQHIEKTHYGLWALGMKGGLYELAWIGDQAD